MAYTEQTWADNDPATPLSAARMQHIEDGLAAAANGGSLTSTAQTGTSVAIDPATGDLVFTTNTAERFRVTQAGLPKGLLLALYSGSLFNVKDPTYGAKGDYTHFTAAGVNINDGAMTAASTTLTCATTTPFTAADVGKVVSVPAAGTAGATLNSTIAAFVDSGHVTLADAAVGTVTGKTISYGTDDTAAWQACLTAAGNSGISAQQGATVYGPQGRYLTGGLTMSGSGVSLIGEGIGDTASGGCGTMLVGRSTMTSTTDLVSVTGARCSVRQIALSGNGNGRDVLRLANTAARFVGDSLYIQNAGVGCGITHGTSVTSLTNKWSNIYVTACGSHGIIVNSSDTEWSNITTFQNVGDGFRCVGTAGAVSNLHTWGNTGAGINHQSGGNGWRFTNTYSETNTGDGVDFTTAIYNTYVGGVIRANAVGINVKTSSKRNTFSALQVYNNTAQGVWVQSGDNCTLDALHCFDDQGSKTQTYGIQIASGVTGTSIIGRLPVPGDNLTGGLNDAGTATIINGAVTAVLAGDQTFNANTTLAAILSIAVKAGTKWLIEGTLIVEGSQAADLKLRLQATGGTGPSGYFGIPSPPAVSAASTSAVSVLPTNATPIAASAGGAPAFGTVGVAVLQTIPVTGFVSVGSTDATLDLQAAQNTSDATNTVVHTGSWLRAVQVG